MLKVSWVWSWEGVTHQVELRHGRRSGIRKVYVDRQLLERQKSMKNMVSDVGSQHEFMVGNRRAEVLIVPKAELFSDDYAYDKELVNERNPYFKSRFRDLLKLRYLLEKCRHVEQTHVGPHAQFTTYKGSTFFVGLLFIAVPKFR